MFAHRTFAATVAIACALGAVTASAQVSGNAETEALRNELAEARAELERARQQLERAARGVAVATVAPFERSLVSVGNGGVFFLSPAQARLGLTLTDVDGGARVEAVSPGGAAAEAGVRTGDVVRSIDGEPITAASALEQLEGVAPGDTVQLRIDRGGEQLDIDVDVETRAATFAMSRAARAPTQAPRNVVIAQGDPPIQVFSTGATPAVNNVLRTFSIATSPWGDMELVAVSEGLGRYFGTEEGLLVVRGPEDDAIGLDDGDVILSIDGRTPSSPEHALRILGSYEPGETIQFSIMRDRQTTQVDYLVPQSESAAGNITLFRGQ